MPNPLDPYFSDELKVREDQVRRIQNMRQRVRTSGCTACPLHKARGDGSNPVPGSGAGRIMFVGHRIGHNEANKGEPAIGQASLTGFKMLVEAVTGDVEGLSPVDARNYMLQYGYVSNAARCGASKSSVGAAAWKRCAPKWLEQEYRHVDPVIVVFWNKGAADTILGDAPGKGEVTTEYMFGDEQLVARNRHPVSVAHQGTAQHTLSTRRAVQSDFQQVLKALGERGYLERNPAFGLTGHDTNHTLVTTPTGLEDMKDDLRDERWIGLDSETFYTAHPGRMSEYEKSKGALLWHDDRQEMTCYQICASDPIDRTVDRTYTVAMRFKDQLTGEPKQELSPRRAISALRNLFRHTPRPGGNPVTREVVFHNASFDAPVFTKEGLDIWGLGTREYDIRVWDTQILAGRVNEHLGVREGMSSLDNLAKMLLHEAKGSFTDEFDPFTFAYEDIHDEDRREEILDYTGEDPRKTILVLFELFDALDEHYHEVARDINPDRSAQPQIGFDPYPKPNAQHTGFRLRDVALPIDHQMIPHVGEMRFIGFEVDTDEIESRYRSIQGQKQTLERLIHDRYEWFNPQSDQDAREIISRIFSEIAELVDSLYQSLPYHKKEEVLGAFQIEPRRVGDQEGVTEEDVRYAYRMELGEVDGQKDTILNKVLVFLQAGMRVLKEMEVELPEDLPDELDPGQMELFFERVFMYKQLHKRASTYFERFAHIADRHDHLRPEYGITTTVSGRFSGNFHNVPRGGGEDREMIEKYLRITNQLPESEEEKEKAIEENRKIDVRETCFAPQPEALNRTFETMNLRSPGGTLWQVREDDTYVEITADYASQEDRMAYALSGDETKAFLLSEGWDTHFTNVAFCFGEDYGYEVQNPDGSVNWDQMKEAYDFFTGDKAKFKPMLRTPMKNVHYASQYGAAVAKIHTLISPIFEKQGQAQPIDSPVLTPDGWTEMGNVQPGDEVIGADGSPTAVAETFDHQDKQIYRVTFNDGSSVRCCGEHLWKVRYYNMPDGEWRVKTTKQLLEGTLHYSNGKSGRKNKWEIPYPDPVEFEPSDLQIDPYVLGFLIGDGCFTSRDLRVATTDKFVVNELERRTGLEIVQTSKKNGRNWRFKLGHHGPSGSRIGSALRQLGLKNKTAEDKFIPKKYLYGSVRQRLDILRGVMDADGHISKSSQCSFLSTSEQLSEDVAELVRSLGGWVHEPTSSFGSPTGFDRKDNGLKSQHRIHFNISVNPCLLPRKANRFDINRQPRRRSIKEIEEVSVEPARCIKVKSEDSLYVTDNYTVTHNTWTLEDTEELKTRYDEFYAGVTQHREEILESLDESPYVNYPIYGAIRHAKVEAESAIGRGSHDVRGTEYLSVANALNQGSCAYVTKTAMTRVRHLIEANAKRWNLVHQGGDTYVGINLQVHDELGLICPARLAREAIQVLESGMKFAVEPGEEKAYWNYEYTDEMGKDGWMCLRDPGFRGGVLFDADAEVKRSVAKADVLSGGTRNVLAHSHDPGSIEDLEEEYPPEGIDRSEELVVANAHEIDTSQYLF